jgi:hypothetical protein
MGDRASTARPVRNGGSTSAKGPGCVKTPARCHGAGHGRFVEGEDRRQALFLADSLDDYVTEDSPVRVVEVFTDELDLEALGFEGSRRRPAGPRTSAATWFCHVRPRASPPSCPRPRRRAGPNADSSRTRTSPTTPSTTPARREAHPGHAPGRPSRGLRRLSPPQRLLHLPAQVPLRLGWGPPRATGDEPALV